MEEAAELTEITERLKDANLGVYDEGETTCCYAKSNKAWATDPTGIPWEAYQNMADIEVYSQKKEEDCCSPNQTTECCVPDKTDWVGKETESTTDVLK